MSEVAFYHLTRLSLEQALPKLLDKTLQLGKHAIVRVGSSERAEALTNDLWTYAPDSWLPHGSAKDGFADRQPIWITPEDENPNGSQFLFLSEGMDSASMDAFERCFVLFDGHDERAVQHARTQWKAWKDQGHALTYWQQTESGGWEKKA